ncbi:hypothetical protein B5K08_13385 [Rhizobium leguminosarum bv. trifolii]|uniref:Cadherin domain-containing protein n=1 Tax=Rhizobium leguminosarum bv. trifolii TaxID=386 RepID=A0A3E1BL37_RHILT|nr:cadherin domain-containing protein [Rhizobium leguminosarum]RFB93271.1 hypothetical protein B5K08_13385 [Rhizobium leguminosarum bv. trifolii]RFB93818.1 hypothetical protein B5K10_13375 [Rhizobium leguminosarum bv. trifolii]
MPIDERDVSILGEVVIAADALAGSTVTGTDGDDVITGTPDNDTLDGGAGNDQLFALEGDDTLVGGDGVDSLFGNDGDDFVSGGGGDDQLDGGAGNDQIFDDDGTFSTGSDSLNGGAGDDTIYSYGGVDTIDGGDGFDRLTIDRTGTVDGLVFTETSADVVTSVSDGGSFVHVEQITFYGGDGNDVVGTADGDDILFGRAGDDTLSAGAGNDQLVGELGNDTLDGGAGNDSLMGGAGDDAINGGAGDDTIYGEETPDVAGSDSLNGGDGDDTIYSYGGADTIDGGDGNDRAIIDRTSRVDGVILDMTSTESVTSLSDGGSIVHVEQVQFYGGSGDDHVSTLGGDDIIYGNDGNNMLSGGGGYDIIFGGSGADVIDVGDGGGQAGGFDGNDVLIGGDSFSYLNGGGGDDKLNLGSGGGQAIGDAGDDAVNGGEGADQIFGNAGSDTIVGGGGSDQIFDDDFGGDVGNDTLNGGDGDDTITTYGGTDTIDGGAGFDRLTIDRTGLAVGISFTEIALDGVTSMSDGGSFVRVEQVSFYGGSGDDHVAMLDGDDQLYGYLGNDTLNGGAGYDYLDGGDGDDALDVGAGGGQAAGGAGDDMLIAGTTSSYLIGGDGSDVAVVSGNFSDYAVSTWSDVGVFLVDQRPASFGQTIQIGEVESFVFADGTRSFDAVIHSPRSIALDVASVAENSAVGTVVGLLSATDPDAGDALTLSLTDDAGGLFAVVGNQLVVNGPLDFETAASHQVTARVTDGTGNTYDRTFTIGVLDVNDSVNLPPTDISLSASTIVENSPAGTSIGTLMTSDPDVGETFTYQLLVDAGGLFSISGDQLVVAGALDHEASASYQVTVRATDSQNHTVDKVFEIGIGNLDDTAPVFASASTATFAENATGIAYLAQAADADGLGAVTYALTGVDAALFDIDASTGAVSFKASPDFETPADGDGDNRYEIAVTASDGVHSTRHAVAISVTNAVDVVGKVINGTDDPETLVGTSGDDEIYSFGGNDVIRGGDGVDYLVGGAGNDLIDGEGDDDTVSYSFGGEDGGRGVTVNLSDAQHGSQAAHTATDTFGGTDTLTSIEAVFGTMQDDLFFGSTDGGYNAFWGLGGNDTLVGGAHDTWAYYHRDQDFGGTAGVVVNLSDVLHGTQAARSATDGFGDTDTLDNIDKVRGTVQADIVYGNGTNNQFQLLDGNDFVDGGNGNDMVDYSRDNRSGTAVHGVFANLSGQAQASFLGTVAAGSAIGLFGDIDSLVSIEEVMGSEFADVMVAVNDPEKYQGFWGLAGNDTIGGGGKNTWVYYFDDARFGGGGGVVVNLSDVSQGGQAAHTATDGFGSTDTLVNVGSVMGTAQADVFYGDQNKNQFELNRGDDFVDGGAGEDLVNYSTDNDGSATHGVFVNLSDFTTTSQLGTVGPHSAIGLYGDVDTLLNIEEAIGSEFDDVLVAAADPDKYQGFWGLAGNDEIRGGGANTWAYYDLDASFGGTNGVVVNLSSLQQGGQAANSATDGFGDTDQLLSVGSVKATALDDVIYGNANANQFELGAGNDFVDGGAGDDTVNYSFDDDGSATHGALLNLSGQTFTTPLGTVGPRSAIGLYGDVDTLLNIENAIGSDFADRLIGNGQDNFLDGGAGDDTLLGGDGADTLVGGRGSDTMDGGNGIDTVDYSRDAEDGAAQGIVVNLLGNAAAPALGLGADRARDSFGDIDVVTNIRNVVGTQFADVIYGGNHANTLSAGAGDDILLGGGDNDFLEGGDGTDTAIYEGNRADYQVTVNADDSVTVADLRVGAPDGADTLTDIELLKFADRTVGPAENSSPVIDGGTTASIAVDENIATVTRATASDPDRDSLVYSISGGDDAAKFQIDTATGDLRFLAAPDYEAPADADGDYRVVVQVSDGRGGVGTQAIEITVGNTNDTAPVFTSATAVSVAENTSGSVYTAQATDGDNLGALVYSMGGTDAALFNIDAATGAVSFKTAPNFESPLDTGADNIYDLQVTASDGVQVSSRSVAIAVTDVSESAPPSAPAGLDLAESDDSGNSNDNITNIAQNLTISGLHQPGATVTLFDDADNDGQLDQSEISVTGSFANAAFSLDISLSEGAHHLRAVQTDGQGQISDSSDALEVTVDTTAPTATYLILKDVGGNTGGGVTINDNTLRVAGITQAGVRVEAFAVPSAGAVIALGSVLADAGGGFSIPTPILPDGTYSFKVTATDVAGNALTQTGPFGVTIIAPVYSISGTPSIAEGGDLVFTISRTASTTNEAVNYSLGGTSTPGADFGAVTGSISFAVGESSKTLTISTAADTLIEGSESVVVSLASTSNGGSINPTESTATGTIVDVAPVGVEIFGTEGADTITPAQTVPGQPLPTGLGDVIHGLGGNDLINGGTGSDTIFGDEGNDTLLGNSGNDTILGGSGDDTLAGQYDMDVLSGGSGRDAFSFATTDINGDTITDYENGEKIYVYGGPGTLSSYRLTFDGTNSHLGIDTNGDGTTDVSLNIAGQTTRHLYLSQEIVGGSPYQVLQINYPKLDLNGAATGTGSTATFVENSAPVAMAPNATVFDTPAENFAGGSLRIANTFSAGTDQLSIGNIGTGIGQISLSGSSVLYQGVTIGSFSGGAGGVDLVINFTNANANLQAVQALVKDIYFSNPLDNFSTISRTFTYVLTDAFGDQSSAAVTVDMVGVNDPPVLTLPSSLAYTENQGAVFVAPGATVSDLDAVWFSGGALDVAFSSGGFSGDQLTLANIGTGAGQIGISGNTVTYQGAVLGTASGGQDGSSLHISLATTTVPTFDAVQALLRDVQFHSTSEDPAAGPRTLTFTLKDGGFANNGGSDTGSAAVTVAIAALNDAPNLTPDTPAPLTYTGAAVGLLSTAHVVDPDNPANFGGGQITIALAGGDPGDRFSIMNNLPTGNVQVGVVNGVLHFTVDGVDAGIVSGLGTTNMAFSLNANATASVVDALLKSLIMDNVNQSITAAPRSATITFSDGGNTGSGGPLTDSVSIQFLPVATNHAPVITSNGGADSASINLAENTLAIATIAATDPDSGQTLIYAIAGGDDAARFTIDAATGALSFVSAPNYEVPADADGNNNYAVVVSVSDGFLIDSQSIAVRVTNANDNAPVFASGTTAAFAENGTGAAYDADATDADNLLAITYSVGGADAGRFNIDSATGIVTFKTAPDFETPGDAGGNNVYDIVVTASDGTLSANRAVAITVTDVAEGTTITGTPGNNTLNGTSGDDVINGLAGNDTLNGLAGNDRLIGGTGTDVLDGGTGADVMQGGAGADTYVVDNAGDVVDEGAAGSGGTDLVQSSINFSLVASAVLLGDVENLTLTGGQGVNGTGNALANVITGNSGDNILEGLAGNDTLVGNGGDDQLFGGTGNDMMRGGAGNDVYYVDSTADQADEQGGSGTDQVVSSVGYSLSSGRVTGTVENLVLAGIANIDATGNALDNLLGGNVGDNTLDGRAGADTMSGGAGNDTYIVDNVNDVIIEGVDGSGGIDTVRASLAYTLSNSATQGGVENLVLTGSGNIDGTGNDLDNSITGNNGNNVLGGGGGNDILDGGRGSDTLLGGAGDDTLNGGAGADSLDGGTGSDLMSGGDGNDLYVVDNSGDSVREAAGEGTDTVQTALATFTLSDNVENLVFTGTGGFNGTGNASNNTITGGAGADNLSGGGGNDMLFGGAGNDVLVGGAGADQFMFNTALNAAGVDSITDFITRAANSGVHDRIVLSNAAGMFTALADGTLTTAAFAVANGGLAQDASDRIIYDPTNGWLTYDSNGNAAGGDRIHFATLDPGQDVRAADFLVI